MLAELMTLGDDDALETLLDKSRYKDEVGALLRRAKALMAADDGDFLHRRMKQVVEPILHHLDEQCSILAHFQHTIETCGMRIPEGGMPKFEANIEELHQLIGVSIAALRRHIDGE